MASDNSIQLYDIEAYLALSLPGASSSTNLPLTRFSAQFPINSIPQASCSVALGINLADSNPSGIHNILRGQLQYRIPAKVYAKVKLAYEENNANLKITKDKIFDGRLFVLFDGYMSGSGYRRSGSTIEYTVSLEHWLSDLAVASGMSQDIQPGTADDFVFPATYYDPVLVDAGVILPTDAAEEALAAIISDDVWFGIKAFFTELCLKAKPVGVDDIYQSGGFRDNKPAADALGKFLEQKPYQSMTLKGVTPGIANSIQDTIRAKAESTYVGNSIWDNLIIFSSALLFNVVPLIEKAVIGQKNPNLRGTYKTIDAGEVFSFDLSTNMPKFISGIVLKNHQAAGFTFYTAQSAEPGLSKRNLVVGSYFAENQVGTVAFQMSPEWLIEPATPDDEPVVPPPMAAKQPNGAAQANGQQAARDMRSFADKFAQAMYGNEVLKYRNGQLAGRLRLDISPGSIIKIEASTNATVKNDNLNNTIVAHVDSVGIYLDAAAGQASTSFGLSSIRYEQENASGNLTIDSNPMYVGSFNGAPLHLGNL
jgi:hypothetical protein